MQFNTDCFTIETISPISIRISGAVPWREVEKKFDETYREISRNMSFRGFRKGKVPRQMLEKMFQKHVEKDLLMEVTREALVEFLRNREDLRIVNNPRDWKISPGELAKGQDLSFSSELELVPEVDPQNFEGVAATRYTAPVQDQAVEEELNRLLRAFTRTAPIENAALAAGAHVELSVMGKLGDEAVDLEKVSRVVPESREPADASLEARIAALLPGLEIGALPCDLELEVPPHENQPGGKVLLTITKAYVETRPELNDDFAKETGEAETLEELRAKVRKNLEENLAKHANVLLEREILKAIVDSNAFEVGPNLIRRQAEAKVDQVLMQLGMDPENERFADVRQSVAKGYYKKAEREIRENLLLEAIAKKLKLEATDEEVEARLQEIADRSNRSIERVRADYARDGQMESIRYMIRMEKTLEYLKSKAVITEKAVDRLPEIQEDEAMDSESGVPEHVHGPECDHDHDHDHE